MKKTLCVTLSMLLLITSMPFSTFAKDIVKSTETKNGTGISWWNVDNSKRGGQ